MGVSLSWTRHVSMATAPTGARTDSRWYQSFRRKCVRSRQGFPVQKCVTQLLALCVVGTVLRLPSVYLPVAAVSVLHCKANSTLNMSLLRLTHAKGKKKKGRGREEVGKLLRRQIPPLFEALMLIHSERTSCLSAYTASLLCLPLCFRCSFFSLSSRLTASFNSVFVFFSAFQLSYLFAFSVSFFNQFHRFLLPTVPRHPINTSLGCATVLYSPLTNISLQDIEFRFITVKQGVAEGGHTCSTNCSRVTGTPPWKLMQHCVDC